MVSSTTGPLRVQTPAHPELIPGRTERWFTANKRREKRKRPRFHAVYSCNRFRRSSQEPNSFPRCRYCFGGVVVAGFVVAGFVPGVPVGFTGFAAGLPAGGAGTPDCAL